MLIIFDCDGVLVDSEVLAAKVFSSVLSMFDVEMRWSDCFSEFHGKSLKDCFVWLENNKNIKCDQKFKNVLDAHTKSTFDMELKSVEGVEDVLLYLQKNNIPRCVASNGGAKKIENSLRTTGLLGYFDHLFSAEQVERGKPSPDLFNYAAEQMGFSRENVLVIEDSRLGCQAALNAKMDHVIYKPEFAVSASTKTVDQMSELLGFLESYIN